MFNVVSQFQSCVAMLRYLLLQVSSQLFLLFIEINLYRSLAIGLQKRFTFVNSAYHKNKTNQMCCFELTFD